MFPNRSGPSAGTGYAGYSTTRSGSPICHSPASANTAGGGMSSGLPRGAPLSTQAATKVISSSLSEVSFLNFWIPMFLSMCQGGISRLTTRFLMDLAQGRTSW